ncbi:hypothetical protein LZ554_009364 [Drepanopeziza brunnea f. sp. 'monogermtubi']|nr:hypothetical protein LZ554_009364 [Drepanopeziza brunnea f. sp. 'monogermtubi']
MAGQCPFFPTPIYVATKHALSGFVRSLAPLECPPAASGIPKIRVNAVAPALIKTPLWTENPDKMLFLKDDTGWTTAEAVADVMMALVEGEDNVGGTILEVGKTVRRVETFGDLGPSEGGNGVVNAEGFADPTWEGLMRMMPVEGSDDGQS